METKRFDPRRIIPPKSVRQTSFLDGSPYATALTAALTVLSTAAAIGETRTGHEVEGFLAGLVMMFAAQAMTYNLQESNPRLANRSRASKTRRAAIMGTVLTAGILLVANPAMQREPQRPAPAAQAMPAPRP